MTQQDSMHERERKLLVLIFAAYLCSEVRVANLCVGTCMFSLFYSHISLGKKTV